MTTTIAVVLILIECCIAYYSQDSDKQIPVHKQFKPLQAEPVFLAFGTVMFAYGGTASFPTFQNDMKDKRKFPKSVLIGFIMLIILYAPIAIIGFMAFGDDTNKNIIINLKDGPRKLIAEILMASHLLFAFLLCATGIFLIKI